MFQKENNQVFYFTDSHYSLNSQVHHGRWFPSILTFFGQELNKKILNYFDIASQRKINSAILEGKKFNPDLVICGGDATSGDNEKGMLTEAAQNQYKEFRSLLKKSFPNFVSLWGNHDTGYKYFAFQPGGMTADSYQKAYELIGQPFQAIRISNWTFLLLNTEIIRALRTEHISNELREILILEVEKQNALIRTELEAAERVIVCVHDPFSYISFIWPEIVKTGQSKKVKLTLAGHVHIRLIGQIMKLFSSAARKANLQVIPAVWELFGLYNGCAELSLDNKSYKLRILKI